MTIVYIYDRLTIEVQKEIVREAKRLRMYLGKWEKENVQLWAHHHNTGKLLPEQQLFFMIGLEEKLNLIKKSELKFNNT